MHAWLVLSQQDNAMAQVVNFGAWYPRYSVLDPHHPWPAWQEDMKELFTERLAAYKATTFWRSYAAAHYGGTNGTNTFEEVWLPFKDKESGYGLQGRKKCSSRAGCNMNSVNAGLDITLRRTCIFFAR
jgi:hypothetical protein